jgi:hypothetical protein
MGAGPSAIEDSPWRGQGIAGFEDKRVVIRLRLPPAACILRSWISNCSKGRLTISAYVKIAKAVPKEICLLNNRTEATARAAAVPVENRNRPAALVRNRAIIALRCQGYQSLAFS